MKILLHIRFTQEAFKNSEAWAPPRMSKIRIPVVPSKMVSFANFLQLPGSSYPAELELRPRAIGDWQMTCRVSEFTNTWLAYNWQVSLCIFFIYSRERISVGA